MTNIQQTIDFIEDHIGEELDIDMLAEKIFTSPFYFQKIFTILCDCTASEYIRNRRLTLAGYEIIDTHRSILDIALQYGYESHESFTRAFTRFHGLTPSEARKNQSNLKAFSRISVKSNLTGGKVLMSDFSERGYVVRETGAVYYTQDMDSTVRWFKEVLGWYGQIEQRDDKIRDYTVA